MSGCGAECRPPYMHGSPGIRKGTPVGLCKLGYKIYPGEIGRDPDTCFYCDQDCTPVPIELEE